MVYLILLGNFCPDDSENNKSIVNEWCVGPGTKPKLEVGKDCLIKKGSQKNDRRY